MKVLSSDPRYNEKVEGEGDKSVLKLKTNQQLISPEKSERNEERVQEQDKVGAQAGGGLLGWNEEKSLKVVVVNEETVVD